MARTFNPEVALINVYGPTEAHIVTAYKVPGAPDDWPAVAPIGTPIRGTRIYIVNQAGQKVPPGLPGEVMIGGDAIARGYLHNPRETPRSGHWWCWMSSGIAAAALDRGRVDTLCFWSDTEHVLFCGVVCVGSR